MSAPEIQASSDASFLSTIGINANIAPDTSATVISQLQYLGINQVRAEAPTSASAAAAFGAIGATGVKYDLITTTWDLPITPAMLTTMFSYIDTIAGDVQFIEGPDEVQNDPDTYEGLTGQAEWSALQNTLYQMVQSDPNLTNAQQTTSVLSFSNVPGGTYTSPLASTDFASVHAYGQPGILPFDVVVPTLGATYIAPGKPVIISESGQTTVPTSQGVSAQEQALYDTDLFLDDYRAGVTLTYLYNLQDTNGGPTDLDFSGWYGLYSADGSIKPAGVAIHNLTTILADPGASATQILGSLAYTLSGLPDNGHQILLQKSDGTFELVVWMEDNTQYNTATGTLNARSPASLTLSFGSDAHEVSIFDPIIGVTAIQTLGAVSSLTLALGSDPLIVQIGPDVISAGGGSGSSGTSSGGTGGTGTSGGSGTIPTLTVGTGPNLVVLQVSEDASNGDALFTVSVDGVQVGGTLTAVASHAAGQEQTVDIQGNFAPGGHVVSVDFLNDNGPRNLYVDSTTVNGSTVAGGSHAIYWNGSVPTAFTETTPAQGGGTPTGPIPVLSVGSGAEVLALQMSEDAYLGDAQFTVSVNGNQVGGTLTATAQHDLGQNQTVDVLGNFAPGTDTVTIDFLNDLWNPGVGDRNLYVSGATINGTTIANSALTMYSGGPMSLPFINGTVASTLPTLSVGSGPVALVLGVSENAFNGDAQFTVSIDHKQIGGVLTATANHATGQSQVLDVLDSLATGQHVLTLNFLNDSYSGYAGGGDRNLYLDSATGTNASFTKTSFALYSNGPQSTNFTITSNNS